MYDVSNYYFDSKQSWQEVRGHVIWALALTPRRRRFLFIYSSLTILSAATSRLSISNVKLSIRTFKSKKNKSIIVFHYEILFGVFWSSAIPCISFLSRASKLRFVPDDFRTLEPKTPPPPGIYWFIFVIELLILYLLNSMPLVILHV